MSSACENHYIRRREDTRILTAQLVLILVFLN